MSEEPEGTEPEVEMFVVQPEAGIVPEDGSILIYDVHEFSEATDSLGARMTSKGELEVMQRGTYKWVKVADLGKSADVRSIR
jgi:hypothetical protein